MATYNKVIIIGNLGRDPELRYLPSGDAVTGFTMATTERRKDAEVTTWFRVSAFGKLGEICKEYLRKGSNCYIEGALTTSDYTDREGKSRTTLEVRASEMRLLDRRDANPGGDSGSGGDGMTMSSPAPASSGSRRPAPPLDDDSEIPF